MGRFGALGDAKIAKGLYFQPGSYIIELGKISLEPNRKKVDCFIVETTVLASDNADRPPGCRPSYVTTEDKDQFWSNIKEFIAAVLEIPDPDNYRPPVTDWNPTGDVGVFWEAMGEMVVSPAQPLQGLRMELTCINKKTKVKGTDFTVHQWGKVRRDLMAQEG